MYKALRNAPSWSKARHAHNLIRRLFGALKKPGVIKNLFLILVALVLLGSIALLGTFAWISRDLPDPNSLTTRAVPQATKIFDRTGEHLLYEIYGDENRTVVKMQQGFCTSEATDFPTDVNGIPPFMVQAVITAEDRKFCSHHGFSYTGLLRAFLFGGTRGGGSTLTQQLVKNAILTNERSIIRKAKELLLSIALERKYSKDETLQIYFNEIPYGSTYYGVQSASQNFFKKDVKDLTLAEAATLAALPQLPTYYINNPDALKVRRDWILTSMAELGYVTAEEAEAAKATDTPVRASDPTGTDDSGSLHFVLWVKELLIDQLDLTEREIEQGGLKVITTLDYDKQKFAEEAVKANLEAQAATYNFNNTGLIGMDPKTGQILSMVGSADYFNDEIDGQVNVTLRPLQPGSSFKPIVYAAGFERGYTPNTLLWDINTTFNTPTGPYNPANYNLKENGVVTVRKALQGSLNIPAVKMMYLVGYDQALDFAERLHYTTFQNRSAFGLSVVLGGGEVELLEHTAAYAAFANDGIYHEPVAILKVEDANGNVLQEWKANDGQKVMEPNIARLINNVLSDDAARAYIFGTGGKLTLPGRPAATKTGTTNNNKDAWTMGYTPSLVTGVWVGNTDGTTMKAHADGSYVAAPVWNEYMRRSLEGSAVEAFIEPTIDTTGKAVLDSVPPQQTVVIDKASGLLATERTPARLREEKVCGEYHEILHYVDRNDPRGPVPSNPAQDPYYQPWEDALTAYIARYNETKKPEEPALEVCEVPKESDDLHVEKNTPTISLNSPNKNDDVGRTFDVNLETDSRRGVVRIEYAIDGTVIRTSSNTSGTSLTLPSWVQKGHHTLTATAFDDVDNSASAEVNINVTEAGSLQSMKITNPFANQTIEKTGAPYVVVLEVPNAANVSSITLSAQDTVTGLNTEIATVTAPSALTTISWTLGAEGEYLLSATATLTDGTSVDATPVKVLVKEAK
jgi:membrane peptidoglycan carboxypeptidase